MLKHSLKLALRNLWKNRIHTSINLIGLTIGITILLYIAIWARYEFSFDNHLPKSKRIYRLSVEINEPGGRQTHFARCWQEWIKFMPDHFPEIESMVRFALLRRTAVKYENTTFYLDKAYYCDSTVFDIFDLNLVNGDNESCLRDPGTLIISDHLSNILPTTDLMGTDIELSGEHDTVFNKFEITGVFNALPTNTHFHPDLLVTLDNPEEFNGWAYYYFLLHEGTGPGDILNKISGFMDKYVPEDQRDISTLHLQPITEIHLNSHKDREIENNYSKQLVIVFSIVGIIVYFLAIFNYINLNLALNYNRIKGFQVNRIIGARRREMFIQLITEGIILSTLCIVISIILLLLLTKNVDLFSLSKAGASQLFYRKSGLILLLVIIILTSLLGVVPSYLQLTSSNINPSQMKSFQRKAGKYGMLEGLSFRKILVILQFTVSMILIICSIYINKQTRFLLSNRIGINSGPILVIKGLNWIVKDQYFLIKEKLLSNPYILDVTATSEIPSDRIMDAMGFSLSGFSNDEKQLSLGVFSADDNFLSFFDIPIVAGRNFPPYDPNLKKDDYIINETAVRHLGFTHAEELIGRDLKMDFFIEDIFHGGKIVGVTKDFNLSTLHYSIQPIVIFQKDIWFWNFLIKIDPDHVPEAISYVSGTWHELLPDYAFDYSFNEDLFHSAYIQEQEQASLSEIFTIVSISLAILGLFGLSSLMIEQRTKEIGIRKVNGASVNQIMLLLNKQFFTLVIIATILAIPSAGYLVYKWGQNFAYRTELPWWVFVVAGMLTLLIALLTVSWKSINAARRNPVDALKYE